MLLHLIGLHAPRKIIFIPSFLIWCWRYLLNLLGGMIKRPRNKAEMRQSYYLISVPPCRRVSGTCLMLEKQTETALLFFMSTCRPLVGKEVSPFFRGVTAFFSLVLYRVSY